MPGNDKSMNHNGNMGTLVKKMGIMGISIFFNIQMGIPMANHGESWSIRIYIYINMHTDKQLNA